jgi:lipoprotein NlpD
MRRDAPALVLVALLLVSCAEVRVAPVEERSILVEAPRHAAPPARAGAAHVVASGDTLYGIAFRHGLDYRQLAAWNAIAPPYTIRAGQRLRLTPPPRAVAPTARGEAATYAAPDTTSAAATAPLREPPRAHASPARESATRPAGATATPVRPPAVAAIAPSPPHTNSAPAAAPAHASAVAVAAPPPAKELPSTPPPPTERASPPAPAFAGPVRQAEGVRWSWPTQGAIVGRYAAGDPQRQGVDIRGRSGQSVVAAADGEVVYSGNGLIGYGELIIVKHDARFLSAYAHNRKRLVTEGQRVGAGQPIAEMGRTGAALDMLHFEIRRDGRPVDPLDYLPRR